MRGADKPVTICRNDGVNKANAVNTTIHNDTHTTNKWPSAQVEINCSATTMRAATIAANNMPAKGVAWSISLGAAGAVAASCAPREGIVKLNCVERDIANDLNRFKRDEFANTLDENMAVY
jgi:hypothetical protein